jgi:hypothetical protein
MLPTKLGSFGQAVSEEKIFLNRPITWPPQAIFVSDWLISKKSSTLKTLGQMNQNLVGSIYGRSSIKTAHFRRFKQINQSKTRIACGGHVC